MGPKSYLHTLLQFLLHVHRSRIHAARQSSPHWSHSSPTLLRECLLFYQNVNVLFAAVFPEPLLTGLNRRSGISSFCIVRAEAQGQRQSTAYAVLLLRGALRFLPLVTSLSDVRTFILLIISAFLGRDWSYSFACLVLRAVAATAIFVELEAVGVAGQKDARNELSFTHKSPHFREVLVDCLYSIDTSFKCY